MRYPVVPMSDQNPTGLFAPPRAALDDGTVRSSVWRDPVQLAGILILINTALMVAGEARAIMAGAQMSAPWLLSVTIPALLAVGLVLRGARYRWPTLAALILINTYFLIRSLQATMADAAAADLPVSLPSIAVTHALGTSFRIAPIALLLIGKPGRGRYWTAVVLFSLTTLLLVAGQIFRLSRGLP